MTVHSQWVDANWCWCAMCGGGGHVVISKYLVESYPHNVTAAPM